MFVFAFSGTGTGTFTGTGLKEINTMKLGNAQGFWGDSPEASSRLIQQQPDLDYLTLDYLAEVSMSIMAIQREKDPAFGYARDFLDVIRSLIPYWKKGYPFKIVTNAGGLNPRACAEACKKILKEAGCSKRIGVVGGDDVFSNLKSNSENPLFNNLETNTSLKTLNEKLVTANAYLGSQPIADALKQGAEIVITGRIADPSLTVGPCMAHFNWSPQDYNCLAGATVAGHLIECGTQVTGGIYTNWLDIPNVNNIGYPVIEVYSDGSCIITKPENTGGFVSIPVVKEQLLYEIGDPERYLSPDVTVSFLSLKLEDVGLNRVKVSNATGNPPPENYKVSATYRDGFKAEGMLTIIGPNVRHKAQRCGELILHRVQQSTFKPERSLIECIGAGALVPGVISSDTEPVECMLRVSVADSRQEVVECFTKEIAGMVTSGPQGISGYTSGRPAIRPVFGYWPCLIPRSYVTPTVHLLEG
jgi:hypothetical protein